MARGSRTSPAARLAALTVAICLVAGPGVAAADPVVPTDPTAPAGPAVGDAATPAETASPTDTGAPAAPGSPADPSAPAEPDPSADPLPVDPDAPTAEEFEAAREAAGAVVERLAALADQLARAQAEVDAAHAAAAIALDTYQAEQAGYEAARAAAESAGAAHQQAATDVAAASAELAAFARAGYIQGTTSPGLQALLSSEDPGQLVERAALLEHAGGRKADALVAFREAEQAAEAAAAAAEQALQEAAELKQRAADALAAAEEVEVGARRQAEASEAERAELMAELRRAHDDLAGLVGASEADLEYERQLARIDGAPSSSDLDVPLGPLADLGSSSAAAAAIQAALRWVGTSYAWGGGTLTGPGMGFGIDAGVVGFDCSGLTRYAYAQADIGIARNSRAQYATLPKVARGDLRPGDLVFFATDVTQPTTIHHVALYLGSGRIVEAPYSGAQVRVRSMYWSGYIGAVRPSA